jgi:hypothetical protein
MSMTNHRILPKLQSKITILKQIVDMEYVARNPENLPRDTEGFVPQAPGTFQMQRFNIARKALEQRLSDICTVVNHDNFQTVFTLSATSILKSVQT